MQGVKVTLSTKKVVLLREMKISHQELAAQAVGNKAGDNQMLMALLMGKELVKMLVYSINDQKPTVLQLEKIDDLFTVAEYGQIQKVIQSLMGGDDSGKAQLEIVNSGEA